MFDLQDKTPEYGLVALDGDTILSPHSYDAALYAAGAACLGVDKIMSGQYTRAFVAVRPPGHHAEPNTALGFCLFNNIFIGALHAQEEYGLKKIAIVDFDVHHGNGTETMTRRHNAAHPDRPVLYISTHGYPLFPMTGDPADNSDTLLNILLPEGCGSKAFRALYEAQVFPTLDAFRPELLMLSAGFDAHKNDPLAPINLETQDYGWLGEKLTALAKTHCNGRLVSILEGGYHLEALQAAVKAHLKALEK